MTYKPPGGMTAKEFNKKTIDWSKTMTKNTLNDLNNHLFAELERLSDEDLKGEELSKEIDRSNAISKIASNVVQNANALLKGYSVYQEYLDSNAPLPKMIGVEKDDKTSNE